MISSMLLFSYPVSYFFMNQAFSAKRQASSIRGMPYLWAIAATALILSSATGWPPPVLLVIVRKTTGTLSLDSANNFSSLIVSILPLKREEEFSSLSSGEKRFLASILFARILASVVSKWPLLGMIKFWPVSPRRENKASSADRPWWKIKAFGRFSPGSLKYFFPKVSRIRSANKK